MPARVIFHLPENYFTRYHKAKHLALYPQIEAVITRRGGQILLAPRSGAATWAPSPESDLHIVEGGRLQRPNYLNAALAYLPGFWHLDPAGVLADSSMQHRRFDPALVDPSLAEAFFARLRRDFAQARRSRYGQMTEASHLPQGCIAVFLQGPMPQRRGQAHLSYADLLRVVAKGADGRAVVAKAHPLQKEQGQAEIAKARAEGFDIFETDANVHDVLAAAAVSVSINSAAAIEGFLHGTPAVLFGRSDYAQMVETVRDPADFPAALQRALTTPRDYPRWFQWYFAENCLNLNAPDFEAQLLARFAEAGFDAERLGLH